MKFEECVCICQISRYKKQWKIGKIVKALSVYAIFIDSDGGVWYVHDKCSLAPITEWDRLPHEILNVDTFKI